MAKTHRCPAMSTRFCFIANPATAPRLLQKAYSDSATKATVASQECCK
jgi:hypothetical protein